MQAEEPSVSEKNASLPDRFPVTVVIEKSPSKASKWVDYVWKAVGITVGASQDLRQNTFVDSIDGDSRLQFYSGLQVRLFIDECDSYYHNLVSSSPQCYIVLRQDDGDDEPTPFLVSLSFDEAHAYLEGDDTVAAVDIPPELYLWTESFVLTHYCPQQLKKRKRKNWKGKQAERLRP